MKILIAEVLEGEVSSSVFQLLETSMKSCNCVIDNNQEPSQISTQKLRLCCCVVVVDDVGVFFHLGFGKGSWMVPTQKFLRLVVPHAISR